MARRDWGHRERLLRSLEAFASSRGPEPAALVFEIREQHIGRVSKLGFVMVPEHDPRWWSAHLEDLRQFGDTVWAARQLEADMAAVIRESFVQRGDGRLQASHVRILELPVLADAATLDQTRPDLAQTKDVHARQRAPWLA